MMVFDFIRKRAEEGIQQVQNIATKTAVSVCDVDVTYGTLLHSFAWLLRSFSLELACRIFVFACLHGDIFLSIFPSLLRLIPPFLLHRKENSLRP